MAIGGGLDCLRYWSAVQDSGYQAPYAYLGALPCVPGLTRRQEPRDLVPPALVPPALPVSGTPLSAVSFSDLMAAMRELVRAEATPEGWQAERQKLERRAALLEEQLRSSKVHQEMKGVESSHVGYAGAVAGRHAGAACAVGGRADVGVAPASLGARC